MVLPTAVDVMVQCASPHMSVTFRAGVGAIATPLGASTPRKMVHPATPRPPASMTVATDSISSRPLAQAFSLLVLSLRAREGAGATGDRDGESRRKPARPHRRPRWDRQGFRCPRQRRTYCSDFGRTDIATGWLRA